MSMIRLPDGTEVLDRGEGLSGFDFSGLLEKVGGVVGQVTTALSKAKQTQIPVTPAPPPQTVATSSTSGNVVKVALIGGALIAGFFVVRALTKGRR
jgi:hypothetical protein